MLCISTRRSLSREGCDRNLLGTWTLTRDCIRASSRTCIQESYMKLRTATLAAAVLVAAVSPNLSTTAQARPFGFHGGFGHGGWGGGGHGGWGRGGWGLGGVGVGLATGALIGAAIASPYGYGGGYPAYEYGYDYPAGYGYAPAYSYDYDDGPAYGYGYAPAYGYAAATPYWGGYRR